MGEHVTQFFLGSKAAESRGSRQRPPAGRRPARSPGRGDGDAGAPRIAFVAVDLLVLDDEPLLDVPLLERKRLLESVLPEGDRVRRTAFVREPAGTFVTTWRSLGFGDLAYKTANGRYLPATRTTTGRSSPCRGAEAPAPRTSAPLRRRLEPPGPAARGRVRRCRPPC